MFSQDEYNGTFCASLMINCTPDGPALINHTSVCKLISSPTPPSPSLHGYSSMMGAPQSWKALPSLDSSYSISIHSSLILFQHSSTGIDNPYSPLLSLPLLSFILYFSASDGSTSVPTSTSLLVAHYSITTAALVSGLILCYVIPHNRPPPFQHFSIPVCALQTR